MEQMTLKEFIDETTKKSPLKGLQVLTKLIELEAIENYLNLFYGIELDIKVKQAERREGRFYGKSVAGELGL
jgi:hypothetical protein